MPSRAWSRAAIGVAALYTLWLAGAYAVLLSADRVYLWHGALYALTALLLWKPAWLRPRRARTPRIAHFVVVGTVWSALVAMPLATLLRGDLHSNLLVNALLWLGGCAALAGAWAWLLTRWRWSLPALLAISGLIALAEPGFVVIRSLQHGGASGMLVLLPVLHATHACLVAPVANAYRDAFAPADARPGGGAIALAIVAPMAAFLLGSAAWFTLLRRVLGALA